MRKKEIYSEKLYYGFPIFLIGYKDSTYGYNFTTVSSSYSLGDMLVVGIYKFGNAIKQIKNVNCFTVNIPDNNLMQEIEIGGTNSGKDKFKLASKLNYHISNKIDAPIINNCILNIECEVVQIVESDEFENYSNIIAKIKGRFINEELQKDEIIIRECLNPVLYVGDGYKRSYRYLGNKIHDFGDFS
ncbi:flavin reductase family protein [Clostridium aciditolerans]|uniref:Flavin reductase n=1 Tax=Clostridium aciditolerans TaxID=339861 RepID=A0A934M5W1_9CLOT|nr:flavin reductase [Clostridium aciditolerans]MBI6875682.1 flavin reductase [Clostridium aciditolerans]